MTSTLVMGGFAAFYGSFSEWMAGGGGVGNNDNDGGVGGLNNGGGGGEDGHGGAIKNRVFHVEVGSSCLSILVGVVWLVLLSMGKLEEVFP